MCEVSLVTKTFPVFVQRTLDLSTCYGCTVAGVEFIVGCVMQELAGLHFTLSYTAYIAGSDLILPMDLLILIV